MTESGELLMTGDDILAGQQAWQSIGGQQFGSIWGHGAYQAPDWSADWLHREPMLMLDGMAIERQGRPYTELEASERSMLQAQLREGCALCERSSRGRDLVPRARIRLEGLARTLFSKEQALEDQEVCQGRGFFELPAEPMPAQRYGPELAGFHVEAGSRPTPPGAPRP